MTTSVLQRNQQGFDALMRGHSDDRRSYVIAKLEGMGTTVADPWYLQLANITLLGAILEQVPSEYQHTIQEAQRQFFQELHQEMDALENAKASSIEVKMAATLERLSSAQTGEIHLAPEGTVRPRPLFFQLRVLLPLVTVIAMGVGSFLTSLFMPASYVHAGVELSQEDSLLVGWAKSEEGQLARNLIHWNGDRLTGGGCEQQAKAHETKLAFNELVVTSGICTLFVQDPKTVDIVRQE